MLAPDIRTLSAQAAGVTAAYESNWESLGHPETDILPSVVAQIAPAEQSAKAKGLSRYTWIRYQLARKEALKIAALAPDDLLLVDDLRVVSDSYTHPSHRVLQGIDFLCRESFASELAPQLAALGWKKPEWPDGRDYSEWRGHESLRLRFHFRCYHHNLTPLDHFFQRSEQMAEFRVLRGVDQFCRSCWQGPQHLWLVDAHTMLRAHPTLIEQLPNEFRALGSRWNQLSRQMVGVPLGLQSGDWRTCTLAQSVLGLLHRREGASSVLLEELAMELVSENRAGWPKQWIAALCERWSVAGFWQLPRALYQRLRGDFS